MSFFTSVWNAVTQAWASIVTFWNTFIAPTFNTFTGLGFLGNYAFNSVGPDSNPTLFILLMVLSALLIIVCSYLLGSINFAIIISSKQYHEDIRDHGSKNAGMTNMMRTYGKKAAGFTLLGDALKAVVSCLIGYALLGELGAYMAGLFCILGHVFPVFYKFKGGKGVVTAAVTILMCNPLVFLIVFTMFILIVLITRYISLGSVICILIYPLILDGITRFFSKMATGEEKTTIGVAFAIIMAVIIVLKHWTNIKRLVAGKESKFVLKKSVKTTSEDKDKND